ncbi:hypothetical protein ACTFIY_009154 [Dictyostelium cf. discoideum]
MGSIENISYIITTIYQVRFKSFPSESFILSIKEDKLYCKSLSKDTNYTKLLINSIPYIKIQKKTFAISCIYFNNPNGYEPSIQFYEIDYCEPDNSFSRHSIGESFCVANINLTPNICLLFKSIEGLDFTRKVIKT